MGLVQFEDGHVLYYPYRPDRVAAFAFMVLFILAATIHVIFMLKYRTWYYIPLTIGGICEAFGQYGRAWASRLPNSPRPFMLQLMLILVSPVFIAATVYVTLDKLNQTILARPKRCCTSTAFFVVIDILAFCSQIGGGLVQVSGNMKVMKIGDDVVLGGLIFQLLALAVYLALVCIFYRRAKAFAKFSVHWEPYVWGLAAAVIAIWVRNLVRALEFTQGFYGFISQHEAMLYVFDAFLMFFVMSMLILFHFGRLLRDKDKSERLETGIGNFEAIKLSSARTHLHS